MQSLPSWRVVGEVVVNEYTSVAVGDPCYGYLPELVCPSLLPGTWVWEVRDVYPEDNVQGQVAGVRISHKSHRSGNWVFEDEYGYYLPDLGSHNNLDGQFFQEVRGVDAGLIAFELRSKQDTSEYEYESDCEEYMDLDKCGSLVKNNNAMVTFTGYGDGCYPVVARVLHEHTVEVCSAYMFEDPNPLSLADFCQLLPNVFTQEKDALPSQLVGPLCLVVNRHEYTTDDGQKNQYDTLRRIELLNMNIVFTSVHYGDKERYVYNQDIINKVDYLLSRLATTELLYTKYGSAFSGVCIRLFSPHKRVRSGRLTTDSLTALLRPWFTCTNSHRAPASLV